MTRIPLLAFAATLTTGVASADPSLPAFDPAAFAAPKANPWFPVDVGGHFTIAEREMEDAEDEDADEAEDETAEDAGEAPDELTRITVVGPGPVVLGVQTTQILDEEWEEGLLIERTFDLVANDALGNVWYFGEDVTNYEYHDDGTLKTSSTDGSWRAGAAGALPGILVPGAPVVGQSHFIGQAPAAGEMDYWEVLALDAAVTGPAGSFTGVLKLRHGSAAEPEEREAKFYAPGLGLIREEDELSPALDNPGSIGERLP